MDGDAAKEDEQEEQPLELLTKGAKEGALARSIAKRSSSDIVN